MEEIIARRMRGMLACYIVITVCGAIISLFGIFYLIFVKTDAYQIYMLVLGILLTGLGVGFTVFWARMPEVFVKYADGKLILSNGVVCSPSEVDFCTSCSYGLVGAGALVISISQKQYKFKYASRVDKAAQRINELKAQSLATQNATPDTAQNEQK